MTDWVTLIGLAASLLVTVAYIPEVVKTVRSRHTRDLALSWLIALDLGQVLFLIYGMEIASIPITIAAGCAVVMLTIMLGCKVAYKNR